MTSACGTYTYINCGLISCMFSLQSQGMLGNGKTTFATYSTVYSHADIHCLYVSPCSETSTPGPNSGKWEVRTLM